jgi:Tfp pilus assembly protein PilF
VLKARAEPIAVLIEKLEAMLAAGQDSAGLRFALANQYFRQDDALRAIEHAQVAVELQPDYSAAWRLLGRAQVAAGQAQGAAASFQRGIEVAIHSGDRQVEKEMRVFLRRLQKDEGSRD